MGTVKTVYLRLQTKGCGLKSEKVQDKDYELRRKIVMLFAYEGVMYVFVV